MTMPGTQDTPFDGLRFGSANPLGADRASEAEIERLLSEYNRYYENLSGGPLTKADLLNGGPVFMIGCHDDVICLPSLRPEPWD